MKTPLNLVQLTAMPIWEQLRLEEALLRTSSENWCLLNGGTAPAIVLGISGKPEQLISQVHMEKAPLPLVRRFSGGGTVVVDGDTLFTTLIINQPTLPTVAREPGAIMEWTTAFYAPLFPKGGLQRRENDYAFEERKCGGNAQYLCHERWLHHTSWLWDFNQELMDYLLMPSRQPAYRAQRSHREFVGALKPYVPSKEAFFKGCVERLRLFFELRPVSVEEAKKALALPHRATTVFI